MKAIYCGSNSTLLTIAQFNHLLLNGERGWEERVGDKGMGCACRCVCVGGGGLDLPVPVRPPPLSL